MEREEAIRRIKAWNLDSDDMEVLSVAIPELRESEDERIRKTILTKMRACQKQSNFFSNDEIAYLEKQKEQKPAEWSEEDEKTLDCIINILDRLGYEEFCKSSRDKDIEEERFYYKEIQCLKKLKSLCPQPKQEWSEKDKKMLWIIQLALTKHPITDKQEKEAFDWLNSLRPQPHTVSIKDATKFGNLEYERGVKDGIQSEKAFMETQRGADKCVTNSSY